MPTSDMIFFGVGLADFAFVLLFIAWTGLVTRKETRAVDKDKASQPGK